MLDARPQIDQVLNPDDLRAIALAVSNAYKGCTDFMQLSPVTANFPVGRAVRPHLLNVFVEHALMRMADARPGFRHEIRPNAAKNCQHVQIFKGGLALTAHYMGAKDFRTGARHAEYRANLAQRNLNLFGDDEISPPPLDTGYVTLLHGGTAVPEFLMLTFPDDRYDGIVAAGMTLEIPAPTTVEAEAIIEEFRVKAKEQQRGDEENGDVGKATG